MTTETRKTITAAQPVSISDSGIHQLVNSQLDEAEIMDLQFALNEGRATIGEALVGWDGDNVLTVTEDEHGDACNLTYHVTFA